MEAQLSQLNALLCSNYAFFAVWRFSARFRDMIRLAMVKTRWSDFFRWRKWLKNQLDESQLVGKKVMRCAIVSSHPISYPLGR
jgi:hypothetical protein